MVTILNFKFQISIFVRRNSNFKFQPLKFKFENLTAKIKIKKKYNSSINMIIFLMFFIHLSYILFINSISPFSLTIYPFIFSFIKLYESFS